MTTTARICQLLRHFWYPHEVDVRCIEQPCVVVFQADGIEAHVLGGAVLVLAHHELRVSVMVKRCAVGEAIRCYIWPDVPRRGDGDIAAASAQSTVDEMRTLNGQSEGVSA